MPSAWLTLVALVNTVNVVHVFGPVTCMQLITMPASLTNHGLRTLRHILHKMLKCFYCKQMDAELDYVAYEVNYVMRRCGSGTFRFTVFSLLAANVPTGNFCSQERKFVGAFAPENFHSREISFLGVNVLWNIHSAEQ